MNVSALQVSCRSEQPRLGIEPLDHAEFRSYISTLDQLVDVGEADLPAQVAKALAGLLEHTAWLPDSCCEAGQDTYRRHVLYADPEGRYTVLALVWQPGQGTPVHGHTAWGAVGVYQGGLSVEVFNWDDTRALQCQCNAECAAGDVCHVVPGIDEPHRIFNASDQVAISIHTYGCDLVADPARINILV